LPAASNVNDEGDKVIADFLYWVIGRVAVAPSVAVTVIVDVLSAVVLENVAAATVIVVPEMDAVSQVSSDGKDTAAVTPVESPETETVFAMLFKF
jgi:hypothetical protein